MRSLLLVVALLGSARAEAGEVADLIAAKKTPKQHVTLRGFVSWIYRCPPCPEGADCKPCNDDHFMLSDTAKPDQGSDGIIRNAIVVWYQRDKDAPLVAGKRYLVEAVVERVNTPTAKLELRLVRGERDR